MQLSTNHIIVSDVDTPGKDLMVWLVSPPSYGYIENTKRGWSFFLCVCGCMCVCLCACVFVCVCDDYSCISVTVFLKVQAIFLKF